LKRILPFLFIVAACSHPAPTPRIQSKVPFKEQFLRNDSLVILKKVVNGRQVEIFCIEDSILLFSQENEKTDTIPFKDYLYAFNDSLDLNEDNYKDLVIYCMPNMHGQFRPFVFLSKKNGKLNFRPDLSLYNICYDTTGKHVISFYIGGVYSEFVKNIYTWKNDSLELIRGASIQLISPEAGYVVKFYKGKDEIPYKTFKNRGEELWDTAVFKSYPDIHPIIIL
jgi:site-specific DNA-adenine methylase